VTADEGTIEVPGGRVWYRSVGEGGTPLLCLHGGPGFTHYYLEPLEALAGRRRVIFYDQLGCGRSDRPDDASLWTVERGDLLRPGTPPTCASPSSHESSWTW
jgi:proline iminopeptidase